MKNIAFSVLAALTLTVGSLAAGGTSASAEEFRRYRGSDDRGGYQDDGYRRDRGSYRDDDRDDSRRRHGGGRRHYESRRDNYEVAPDYPRNRTITNSVGPGGMETSRTTIGGTTITQTYGGYDGYGGGGAIVMPGQQIIGSGVPVRVERRAVRNRAAECAARYRSYDYRTDTFVGRDGRQYRCDL